MKERFEQHLIKYRDVHNNEKMVCTVWFDSHGELSELPHKGDLVTMMKQLYLGRELSMEATGQVVEDEV